MDTDELQARIARITGKPPPMDKSVLLAQLRSVLATAPDFASYSPTSAEHQGWMARAHAYVARWNSIEAISIASAADFMHSEYSRQANLAKIFAPIHRAIAALEIDAPTLQGIALPPGAVYDFFKQMSQVMGQAQTSILVVDPYLDETIFDRYLQGLPAGVSLKLLASMYGSRLKAGLAAFKAQHGQSAEIRVSRDFHDRVIFLDGLSGWVLGQSIKDAAAAKPTYLLPLSADIAALKLKHYEAVWNAAKPL
jgi:hypothetical protein